ncbi:MAG: hypothetical protein AABN95_00310 [Acidobacteriota bacterium]
MTDIKTILRWLAGAAILQSTVFFLVHLVLTKRFGTVRGSLTDALYRCHAATEQVDKANQAFFSISSLTLWILLAGIAATSVGYGLLKSIIIKNWPKAGPADIDSC